MGYTRVPTIYTLDKIKGREGLEVRVKGLKIGPMRKLLKVLDSDDSEIEDLMDECLGIFVKNFVSWNAVDEQGQPVEFSGEDLELEELLEIVSAWIGVMTGPDEDLGKDSTSGESFPAPPLTTEAL